MDNQNTSYEMQTLLESNEYIVLDQYIPSPQSSQYQSENDLEMELISDLKAQGYEYKDIKNTDDMLKNIRKQIELLNDIQFNHDEWERFQNEYLNKPNEGTADKIIKIHEDYIYDFQFDNNKSKNIFLLDKKNIARNKVQVINQFEQIGKHKNRYDVTILINGLPLVHIELKARGIGKKEAFNQINRYSKESFNIESSLYKYIQLFVISNGTDTLYFPNTTHEKDHGFDFTINWALSDNHQINDLKDFTSYFFAKNTLLKVLLHYSILSISQKDENKKSLLCMRPYQIAATERIIYKIKNAHENKLYSKKESGGYIWHTTGSGKTLTSFKAARLATELDFIDKVLFVVDRKDLDYQTMKEYQRFSPDSVNGSNSTQELKANLEKNDNKITVTTIQKLNNLMKSKDNLDVYKKHVVFIFDECHRSQFGEMQRNLKKKFKKYHQFGFTGTPIFQENAYQDRTTENIFGQLIHQYLISDALRDNKVLKFLVEYRSLNIKCHNAESKIDAKNIYENPNRIKSISEYILKNFHRKTHPRNIDGKGFNAIFAVDSIKAAQSYYNTFKELQNISYEGKKKCNIQYT